MFGFSTVNIAIIKEKSCQDVSFSQIRHLCERKDEKQLEVTFFKLPSVAKEIISPLHYVQESSTFQDLWTQYGKKAQAARKNDETRKPQLSISEVVEQVWKPAFQDWNQHAASTMDGTISLGNVDKLFDSYKNRKKDLERELLCMFELSQAQPAVRVKKLETTVTERVTQIQRYQQLGQYAFAADTIWEFKEAMVFTGDFKVIEDLRNQVSKFMFSPFLFRLSDESGFPCLVSERFIMTMFLVFALKIKGKIVAICSRFLFLEEGGLGGGADFIRFFNLVHRTIAFVYEYSCFHLHFTI